MDELNQTKQNAITERDDMIEASRKELMGRANAEHNRILTEKEKERQGLEEKYSELEKDYNNLKEEYESVGEQFDKQVNKAANTKSMMIEYMKKIRRSKDYRSK